MTENDQGLPSIGEIIEMTDFGGSRFVDASRREGSMGIVFRLCRFAFTIDRYIVPAFIQGVTVVVDR